MIYESDICICLTESCPKYFKCYRGGGLKRVGIYTASDLGEVCNEKSNYEAYIPINEEERKYGRN